MILFEGGVGQAGLFDQPHHLGECGRDLPPRRDHAVAADLLVRHLEHADDVAADFVVGLDHLRHAAGPALVGDHQFVGQEDGEGFLAHDRARAPDRVAEAHRDLLAHGDDLARGEAAGGERRHVLAARGHGRLELISHVEMLDDRGFAAAGDEDHLLDPRLARLVHRILDQRAIDHREHFLGDRLGRGQEARAQPRDREDCFSDWLVLRHAGSFAGGGGGVNRRHGFAQRRGGSRGRRGRARTGWREALLSESPKVKRRLRRTSTISAASVFSASLREPAPCATGLKR